MCFQKYPSWEKSKLLDGPMIELLPTSVILIKFHLLWSTNVHLAAMRFFYHSGGQFVPFGLEVYKTKMRSFLLYGAPI